MQTVQLTFSFIGPHPSEFTSSWMQFFAEYCYSTRPLPPLYEPIRENLPRLFVEESKKQERRGLKSTTINTGLSWMESSQGHDFWYHLFLFIDQEYNRRHQ